MFNKYMFFSFVIFSFSNYTSNTNKLLMYQHQGKNDQTNLLYEIAKLEEQFKNLNDSISNTQDCMHHYTLPSTIIPAQKEVASPAEVAQAKANNSTNVLSKLYTSAIAVVVKAEVKLSLAEAARHGKIRTKAAQDQNLFAQ